MTSRQSFPRRLTDDLCKGRISLPEARYFISCSATCPESRLTQPGIAKQLVNAIKQMEQEGDISLFCATIMPDHIHLLVGLSDRLSISRTIGKFKTRTRTILDAVRISWQRNFFEHRLRPNEISNNYARYIFLNPYRAGLIDRKMEWSYWVLGMNVAFDFLELLEEKRYPPSEWLNADLKTLGLVDDSLGHD